MAETVKQSGKEISFDTESENVSEKTGIACDKLRLELKRCIKNSDCVQKQGRSAKDCVRSKDGSVPDRCFTLLSSFSDCKRSIIDMRARFRGRKGDMD